MKEETQLGKYSFYLGTFFLPTALPISYLFFLFSILISSFSSKKSFFKDKYNLLLFLCSCLMIFRNIRSTFFDELSSSVIYVLNWIDLVNWIPFFIVFFFLQNYLKTFEQRRYFSIALIAGTIPVIFSFFLQSWFKIYGPFDTLFGTIVWFQKPLTIEFPGITGLFNNSNYAGLWLSVTIPLIVAEINYKKNINWLLNLILFLTIYCLLLTASKNAFIGLFLFLFAFFGIRSRKFLIPSFLFIFILFSINIFNKIFSELSLSFLHLVPFKIIDRFADYDILSSSRYEIYKIATKLISQRPFTGWGASTFPELYKLNGGIFKVEHTHSMPIEIAFNYGIPIALLLIVFVCKLLYDAFKSIKKSPDYNHIYIFDKCWIISFLIILFSHINDITYYDGKISMLVWILLAGLRSIKLDWNTKINV